MVCGVVYSTTTVPFIYGIALQRQTRYCDEPKGSQDELRSIRIISPASALGIPNQYAKRQIVIFGLRELERLVIGLLPICHRHWCAIVLIIRPVVGGRLLILLRRSSLVVVTVVVRLWRVLHLRLGTGIAVVVICSTAMGCHGYNKRS